MNDLQAELILNGCSSEFAKDAMRFAKLYDGDIDAFIDRVEDILMGEEEIYEEAPEEESDPIYESDYNYEGNEDEAYYEEEEDDYFQQEDDDY